MQARVRPWHETFNRQLKNWGILSQDYHHNIMDHGTKRLWNQRPLRHPAANKGHLHKEVNGRLGLKSCSNKDFNPPCPTPLAPKEMLQGGFGDFYFLWSYWLWAEPLSTGRIDGRNDSKWVCRAAEGVAPESACRLWCCLLDEVGATFVVPPFPCCSLLRPPNNKETLKPEASALSCCQ